MAEKKKNNKEAYRKVRDEFDSLKIEEKAVFLVESAFSTIAHGIESLGDLFSEQINKVYEEEETKKKETKSPPKAKKTTRKTSTSSRAKSARTPKPKSGEES